MKMSERIRRKMQPNRPSTMISLRLPSDVLDDLKELAPTLGFGGYQGLIKAYISTGLRQDLAEREAQLTKESTVEEFRLRLIRKGLSAAAVDGVAEEMRKGSASS